MRKNAPAVIFFAIFVLASNAIYDLHQHHPKNPVMDLDSTGEDESPSRNPSSIGGITHVTRPSVRRPQNTRPNHERSDSRYSDTNEIPFEPPANTYSAPTTGGGIPSIPAYVPSRSGASTPESHSVSNPTKTAQSTSDSDDDSVHDIAQMPHPSPTPYGLIGNEPSIVAPNSTAFVASTLPPISGFSITSGGGTCAATGIFAQVSIGEILNSPVQTGTGILAIGGMSGVVYEP